MSVAAGRRTAIVALLLVLGGAPLLALAPGGPGGVQIAGVAVLWWYAALAAPLAAALVAGACLLRAAG